MSAPITPEERERWLRGSCSCGPGATSLCDQCNETPDLLARALAALEAADRMRDALTRLMAEVNAVAHITAQQPDPAMWVRPDVVIEADAALAAYRAQVHGNATP